MTPTGVESFAEARAVPGGVEDMSHWQGYDPCRTGYCLVDAHRAFHVLLSVLVHVLMSCVVCMC